ncbi:MAG TPA: hypothetical protein DDW76_10265 [Cyanobacteria bacterium UBA11369]|nr:hypothetical protein [Cyanobacteria bacterium UBA11368]HBE49157.1 hypothetical protein [Cyanobacteria bacterium UBA11369]
MSSKLVISSKIVLAFSGSSEKTIVAEDLWIEERNFAPACLSWEAKLLKPDRETLCVGKSVE